MALKTRDYITIIKMDQRTGKEYAVKDGNLIKSPAPFCGYGWGETVHVSNVNSFSKILKSVSEDTNSAIILGYIQGTECGKPYRLVPKDRFLELARKNKKRPGNIIKKTFEVDGVTYAARVKTLYSHSSWFGFDRDLVDGMPDLLKPDANFEYWWKTQMYSFLPMLKDVSYVCVGSASSRVVFNNEAMAKGNAHVYMRAVDGRDTERFGSAALVHSFSREFGFLRPVFDSKTKRQIGNRKWTIFDPTTFSRERIFYDGKPSLASDDETSLSEMIDVIYIEEGNIEAINLSKNAVNTRELEMPTKEEMEEIDVHLEINTNGKVTTSDTRSLTGDITITVKNPKTNEISEITVYEFINGDVDRYRCQTPFRPDSVSWAGYISKENGCHPFLHDVGTQTTYRYNNVIEMFRNDRVVKTKKVESSEDEKNSDEKIVEGDLMEATDQSASTNPPSQLDSSISERSNQETKTITKKINNEVDDIRIKLLQNPIIPNQAYGYLQHASSESRLTESGLAEIMNYYFGRVVKYVTEHKAYFVWNGVRWEEANDGITRQFYNWVTENLAMFASSLSDDEVDFIKFVSRALNKTCYENTIKLFSHNINIITKADRFDTVKNIFSVGNGYIDLNVKNGKLVGFKEPDIKMLLTKGIEVNYDKNATCPEFEKVMMEIMSHDKEMVDYIQRLIGYTMLGRPYEDIAIFLKGEGSNGKSTFMHINEKLFGSYKSTIDKDVLMNKTFVGNESPSPQVFKLRNSRIVSVTEIKSGDTIDDSQLKKLSSGTDTIVARDFYQSPVEFKPTFVVWIPTNNDPIINSTDDGTWRRVIKIPFDRNFKKEFGEDTDKELGARIIENEMPGVLNWALEGCLKYQLYGLNTPQKVLDSSADYRNNMDALALWLEDCCILGDDHEATTKELFLSYQDYSSATNDQTVKNAQVLAKRLRSKGFTPKKRASGTQDRGWKGLKVKVSTNDVIEQFKQSA